MTHGSRPLPRLRAPFYGWWMVALTIVINGMGSGPIWSGVGIWVKALEGPMGWSRTQLTGAFSLAQLEGSFIGPVLGYLTDRFGSRRMVLTGMLIIGGGFMLFSYTTNLAMFYVAYSVIMFGAAAGTYLPLMASVNRWFVRKRGIAMAVAGEGYFIGGIALVPILAWAVNPDHSGWEVTSRGIGIVFLAIAWPISRLIRNSPEEYGLRPDGDPPSGGPAEQLATGTALRVTGGDAPDFTAREAMRTPSFWLISLGHGLCAMMIATTSVHMVPLLTDQGLSLQMASYVWAAAMGVGAMSALLGGYVGDRVPKHLALFVFATIQGAGFALAVAVDSAATGFLFAVVFGFGNGGRNPLVTAIRGDYFGKRAFATITGISTAPLYILTLVAPLFAAALFDIRDSYTIPFSVLGALGLFSGFLFLMARRPAYPARPGIPSQPARDRANVRT